MSVTVNESAPALGFPKKWARAEELGKAASVSRPMAYKLVKRFRIPSVSLGEGGKCGARLFRIDLFLKALDKLAVEQKGKAFPHNKGHQAQRKHSQKGQTQQSPSV